MSTLMTLQLSVGLFVGMAAAMLVPRVRRWVPFWIEALIWVGLVVACWLAITNIQQINVRYLTESAAWGLGRILNTSIGFMFAGLLGWMADHRFGIATAVVLVLGADALALSLVWSHRKAEERRPRILLGEWIEIPLYRTPALAPVAVPYAMDELNRRAERAAALLAAAFLTWLVQMLIWTRDVVVPRARARQAQAVAAGRVRAARIAIGGAGLAEFVRLRAMTDDQLVNISTLLSAQSVGWYGPIAPASASVASDREKEEEDESDLLAS